jgi:Uma2 family endonuclease
MKGVQDMAQETEARPASQTSRRMTYEEFLELPEEEIHYEWVEGEAVPMSPVSDRHSMMQIFLLALMQTLADDRRIGAVRGEPFQMKAAPHLPGRSPDILFVAAEHLDRLRDTHLEGPADLAVEIISPGSRARDRGEKYFEYAEGGVREYWVIDPERRQAWFFLLGDDGAYHEVPLDNGVFRSSVMDGLWLRVDWLWQDTLPPVLDVLREWGLIQAR